MKAHVLNEIAEERMRQIMKHRWTATHDDLHKGNELALAAACYASPVHIFRPSTHIGRDGQPYLIYVDAWPWGMDAWKRSERRRELIKAAALIVAEIERIDRERARAAD